MYVFLFIAIWLVAYMLLNIMGNECIIIGLCVLCFTQLWYYQFIEAIKFSDNQNFVQKILIFFVTKKIKPKRALYYATEIEDEEVAIRYLLKYAFIKLYSILIVILVVSRFLVVLRICMKLMIFFNNYEHLLDIMQLSFGISSYLFLASTFLICLLRSYLYDQNEWWFSLWMLCGVLTCGVVTLKCSIKDRKILKQEKLELEVEFIYSSSFIY